MTLNIEISPNGQTPNLYKDNLDLIVRLVLCDVLTIHYVIANGRMRGVTKAFSLYFCFVHCLLHTVVVGSTVYSHFVLIVNCRVDTLVKFCTLSSKTYQNGLECAGITGIFWLCPHYLQWSFLLSVLVFCENWTSAKCEVITLIQP